MVWASFAQSPPAEGLLVWTANSSKSQLRHQQPQAATAWEPGHLTFQPKTQKDPDLATAQLSGCRTQWDGLLFYPGIQHDCLWPNDTSVLVQVSWGNQITIFSVAVDSEAGTEQSLVCN